MLAFMFWGGLIGSGIAYAYVTGLLARAFRILLWVFVPIGIIGNIAGWAGRTFIGGPHGAERMIEIVVDCIVFGSVGAVVLFIIVITIADELRNLRIIRQRRADSARAARRARDARGRFVRATSATGL